MAKARRVTPTDPDRLLDAIQAAQRLVVACDALGEDVAGTYVATAIDVLRASPILDGASAFREAGAHAIEAEGAQPDV